MSLIYLVFCSLLWPYIDARDVESHSGARGNILAPPPLERNFLNFF